MSLCILFNIISSARRVDGADVKWVHGDAAALLDWGLGLIDGTPNGKLHVPYDKIHAELDLLAAA
jgi:hypothetical protein